MLQRAMQSAGDPATAQTHSRPRDRDTTADERDTFGRDRSRRREVEDDENSDSDESIGPTLPGQDGRPKGSRMGPSIPGMQDLELKRGSIISPTTRTTTNNPQKWTLRT